MLTIRKAADRGRTNIGWLDSRHTFSFGDYRDPKHTRFRTLRVINDDVVAPGGGFDTHPHRDMEILTWVLDGALEHRDSTGGGGVLRPGDAQVMTAGRGIAHSEFNHSRTEPVRLLQTWIFPEAHGLEPAYSDRRFPAEERRGRLRLIASRDGAGGSLVIHQDARVYAALLAPGEGVELALPPGRGAWVQAARGSVRVNGEPLAEGDGAAVEQVEKLTVEGDGADGSEVLVFDLA